MAEVKLGQAGYREISSHVSRLGALIATQTSLGNGFDVMDEANVSGGKWPSGMVYRGTYILGPDGEEYQLHSGSLGSFFNPPQKDSQASLFS